jgi:NAD+ kinase
MTRAVELITKKEYPELDKFRREFKISNDGELCIVVGGDGTFIGAASSRDKPILFVRDNSPMSAGYNSDISLSETDYIIDQIKRNAFKIEDIGKKIKLVYNDKTHYAVNDVVLHNVKEEVYFEVYRKGEKVYPFPISGDGIIISNRVGSTAYNRSAGGPILIDQSALCLTFISPDSPFTNSLVFKEDDRIEVKVLKGRGLLSFDNTELGKLSIGSRFEVSTSKKPIKVIKLRGREESISDKLHRLIIRKMSSV